MDEFKRSREKQTTLNENSIITFSDYKINIPTDFFKITRDIYNNKEIDGIERFRRYARCKSSKNNYQIYKLKFMVCEICGLRELV